MITTNKRIIAVFFIVLFITQITLPTISWALTSGPTQPELQSFQPAGTTEMVDLFSGDFAYNIPLFELPGPNGGYPFNLSYQAGITMDQEASWVGLGWSLQPGAITRQMRGLPDEFKGDTLKTKMSIDPSVTIGLGIGAGLEIFGGDAVSLGVGLGAYRNSYKGMGYSIDASVGFSGATKSGMTGGLSLGLSLDSKEGVGVTPSLNLGGEVGQFGLNAPYNSKQGLSSISLTHTTMAEKAYKGHDGKKLTEGLLGSSATLSLANPGYTPQISMPMKNINLSATFKAGGAWWGVFAAPYVSGFYNEQWLDNDKKWVPVCSYGYLNYQNRQSPSEVLDFNREKDGMVSKETPNLGISSLTYDIYSVTGQGIGMMYRPIRNDHGIVHDQETSSISNAVGVGVDVGTPSHVGVNLSVNHSKATSGAWNEDNNILNVAGSFQAKGKDSPYEPVYFKVHGESTSESASKLNSIGGEKAFRVQLSPSDENPVANAKLENRSGSVAAPNNSSVNRDRATRNQAVESITNGELVMASGSESLPHFKVTYFDSAGIERAFIRDNTGPEAHHTAGYTALTAEGLRYVYGIPAYNLYQEDVTFSVREDTSKVNLVRVNQTNGQPCSTNGDPCYEYSGTDKFLKRTELPKYTHSHLLTSILGPDYVDVTNDGVTEDDLGYWVKFKYKQTSRDYKWRDPYSQAHFQEGWRTDPRDDKGSFTYGKKELWYLAQAETKSHIAEFSMVARRDGKGVNSKLQDDDTQGEDVYELKQIKLYTRSAGSTHPIKVTKFEYDYSLCKEAANNDGLADIDPITSLDRNLNKGKLTLKKVWFEYGSSTRGSLNPYSFTYHLKNPSYDILAYDRWGNYKPYPSGQPYFNNDFPYAEQDPAKKVQINENAAVWSLKEITLPSGGKITVDYESDDYAYVQNKTAMQMTSIVDPYTASNGSLQNIFLLSQSNNKIRFKLESPITQQLTRPQQKDEVMKYIDTKTWQLYFKLLLNLKKPGKGIYEYITGYADIDKTKTDTAYMKLEKNSLGQYAYGCFYVKSEEGKHPFSMRAWQHLRTNQPELANTNKDEELPPPLEQSTNTQKRLDQIKSLGNIGLQIKQLFKGFNNYCNGENWGKEIDASKSWIRLNSPDKIKYGGGLRVKQITMKDEWAEDKEGVYGQSYEYTTTEGIQTISSGVAAYEPIVGGDENGLRYAKKYVQSIPLRSDNNLFFEYPANESNYPGAQVGYQKVTVMSLASAALAGKPILNATLSDGQPLFPQGIGIGYGTSGMTVHEFYTAKDFPVITDETEKENRQFRLSVPIPLLGTISIVKLTTSQGYSIITNDMHGKQKGVSNYKQAKDGTFEQNAISWVKHNYRSEQKVVNGEKVFVLNNLLVEDIDNETLLKVPKTPTDLTRPKFYLGQESEFFYDMRQYEDNAWSGGARLNTDIIYIPLIFAVVPIPIPTVWPSIGKSKNQLRVASTNKIIFKSGILESVEAFDGGSLVKTSNLKWDKQTGVTVLTSVNNNFNNPVYNYTIPAFREYQGMGASYQNIGVTFDMNSVQRDPYKIELYQFQHKLPVGTLEPGDEILLYPATGPLENPIAKVVYTGEVEDDEIFYCEQALSATNYQCMIVRSGYRNQLAVSAGTITALQDPSLKGTEVTYTKTISVPK